MKKATTRIDKKEDHVITHGSDNIFIDLGFEPAEASIKLMRANLLIDLQTYLEAKDWTQSKTAKRLGITQPRVSRLMKGAAREFSLDMLLLFAARLGLKPEVRLAATQTERLAA
jgi:predicted XRE-type DNA-binding protein